MKNVNTITHRIIANHPQVTTVTGPQKIHFPKIKRKRRAKTATQAQIQRLSPPVYEVVTDNVKKTSKRSLKRSFKKLRQDKNQ